MVIGSILADQLNRAIISCSVSSFNNPSVSRIAEEMSLEGKAENARSGCSWSSTYSSLDSIDSEDLARDYNVAQIIASKRVLRVRVGDLVFYLIGSGSRVHLIIPRIFCSCTDFSINVVSRCSKPYCIHIAAAELAERKGLYREVTLGPGEFSEIISLVLEGEVTYKPIV